MGGLVPKVVDKGTRRGGAMVFILESLRVSE